MPSLQVVASLNLYNPLGNHFITELYNFARLNQLDGLFCDFSHCWCYDHSRQANVKRGYFCWMNEQTFKDIDLSSTCFEELSNFFEAEKLEQLGREVKFVERSTSRLSAWMFLQLNTCLIGNGKTESLNDLGVELFNHFGISLTKQSLDERFNIHGVTLMRKCLEQVFEKVLSSNIPNKRLI